MATTPMIAISSMSAPVKANPLELTGVAEVVDPVVTPSDDVTVGVMPVDDELQPV
jgi:hypothetical protein